MQNSRFQPAFAVCGTQVQVKIYIIRGSLGVSLMRFKELVSIVQKLLRSKRPVRVFRVALTAKNKLQNFNNKILAEKI